MRQYRGFDVGRMNPKAVRQILQGMDVYLRQASRQFSFNDTSDSSTAGNLSSIAANGGPKVTGDITFSSTPTISITNLGQDFSWGISSLPATVFGAAVALGANTALTDGVLLTASHSDHAHSIASAAHSGGYATAATTGAGNDFMRSSAILEFPSALMPVGTTKTLTLTDDATEGALLTAANTFSANAAAIFAPNATNALRIGKYGNLALAGTALADATLLNFSKTDYNETVNVAAIVGSIGNTNVGTSTVIARGLQFTVSGSCSNAAALTTNTIDGCRVTLSGGATGNNNFQGSLIGYRVTSNTLLEQTAGTPVAAVVDFQSSNTNSWTRPAVTDRISFEAKGSISLLLSATLTNHYGFKCNALTAGTNRIGCRVDGMTTGTPTVSIGLDVGSHSVGTDRWGVRAANKIENTATDFIASTAGKGYICKDAQGTAEYWRMYTSVSGATVKDATWTTDADGFASFTRAASATGSVILNLQDTGTTAPTA